MKQGPNALYVYRSSRSLLEAGKQVERDYVTCPRSKQQVSVRAGKEPRSDILPCSNPRLDFYAVAGARIYMFLGVLPFQVTNIFPSENFHHHRHEPLFSSAVRNSDKHG